MAKQYLHAAQQYHSWGANVLATGAKKNPLHIWSGGKDGTGPDWTVNRQTSEDVSSFPWDGANGVGIVNGPGGWHTFDFDAIKDPETKQPIVLVGNATVDTLLTALGLPLDYPWVWRGQSQSGWGVAIHCDDPLPSGVLPAAKESGVAWGWPAKDSGADWHHLELRYSNCQTVYPPSARYTWRHAQPTDAPATVPIHRVLSAFFALCPPPPHTLGSIDRATIDEIRRNFDMVAYAESVFGGELKNESGGEVRLLGHGGMLINQDKGIWNAFGDDIGGDAFDMVAYKNYRTNARNLNGKSAQILEEAAAWAGVTIPERKPDNPLSTPSDRPGDRDVITGPRFTVSTEEKLAELPPVRYLDRELGLVAKAFHLIYGASGSGKTFFAIERAMRQVALGRRVLYIPTEDVQGLRYRLAAWRLAHPDAGGRLSFLEMPEGLDLQDYNQVAELIEAVTPYEYDHIILDTLREAHSGDENSSQDTRRINRAIQRLVVTGAAVDVVHHTGVNGERPRGSTALFGNADAVIKVEGDDGLVRVSFDKLRNAPPRDALAFGMVQQDTGLTDTDGEPVVSVVLRPAGQFTQRDARITPTQRKVLQTLALSIFSSVGAKAQQVIDTAEISRRHAYLALAALKTRGFASQGDKGDPYYITSAGRAQLGPDYATASDLPNSASVCASDLSDQRVITSDLKSPDSVVIHSDHTRRVITGSHIDHTSTQAVADLKIEGPTPAARMAARSRRTELVNEYERVVGELTETLTTEELESAIAAAEQDLF